MKRLIFLLQDGEEKRVRLTTVAPNRCVESIGLGWNQSLTSLAPLFFVRRSFVETVEPRSGLHCRKRQNRKIRKKKHDFQKSDLFFEGNPPPNLSDIGTKLTAWSMRTLWCTFYDHTPYAKVDTV